MSDTPELDALIAEAIEWLRIPSISAGTVNPSALREAARWAHERVLAAGGSCQLVETPTGGPLVVGELLARRADCPTVLIYGHYDVQDPGDQALWDSPPFAPQIRDGRLYARGACDDKGNFLPLLHVACAMAAAGELGVHVRVLIEGGEETDSDDVNRWVAADERGADAAIVFDTPMLDESTPALTVATRGIVSAHVELRTGERALHSGLYGGAALNALHALHAVLGAVLPDVRGRLPEALRAGVEPPAPEEVEAWQTLAPGARMLDEAGARPADATAAAEFHARTTAETALDVHCIAGGEDRTVIPSVASASLSVRLAPGQDPRTVCDALEAILRDAAPAGAELVVDLYSAAPSRFEPGQPALRVARAAIRRALSREPALQRLGGSLPILAAFMERDIPAIVTGFALPDDNFHAPNESFAIASLDMGRRAARALLEDLAALPRSRHITVPQTGR